ncbi:HAMP domain-containing sensor histidine kinase [Spirochaetia bacterium 38H-sp]|uniref:histidine kinase n=1 Tax=Rarispira pelagica TaxID=3141764 RepID=A0ABU9U9Q6_9SPIR
MREKRLIYRIFLALGLSFAILSALLSVVLVFSLNASTGALEREREKQIEKSVAEAVKELASSGEPFTRQSLNITLRGFRDSLLFLFVFDNRRDLIYSFIKWDFLPPEARTLLRGRIGDPNFPQGMGGMMKSPPINMDDFLDIPKPVPVMKSGTVVAYISVKTLPVSDSREWAAFLSRLVPILIAGVFLSLLVAGIVLFFVTSDIARVTELLADGLDRIGRGQRNVSFPFVGISELAIISRSASKLQEQLLQEERLRIQWAQDIAHDLRTPITALRSQLELLEEGIVSAEPARIEKLLAELGRLEELVSALSILTRLESPETLITTEPVDIKRILEQTAIRFAEAKDRPLKIETEQCAEGSFVLADPSLLIRLLENLLDNAYKHAKGDGPVIASLKSPLSGKDFPPELLRNIKTERSLRNAQTAFPYAGQKKEPHNEQNDTRKYILLVISNPGKIEKSDLPYIFERLYRGEKSRGSRGSGLGLSIAKAITEKFSGTIRAENSQDRVNISLVFPLAEKE